MMRLLAGSGIAAHEAEELVKKDFKFWKTQPVPALGAWGDCTVCLLRRASRPTCTRRGARV